ncbi:RNA polymerase sigma factor [Pseudochryseolinea flava]|uniref:Sigma-70 family RNA polymerase sigma factor n=1 Tax=Pseudochryseolinea flava TaxID=2059302 RepID=A0A364Y2D9_9BACT|nr:sigma-70 family RNA polymerase sigma factor [Pseudochryseolinea flava]RAW00859.1 sigma-70 family RNA polymerase sigma factor [Pseudochryseolinea flava]
MVEIVEHPPVEAQIALDFEALYKRTFPVVAKLVHKWNGSLDDAKDVFHDGLVLLYEKMQDGVQFQTSREAYLVGICKNLWVKKFSKDVAKVALDEIERSIEIPGDFYPTVNTQHLLTMLMSTGKRCLALLEAMYFKGKSVERVAQDLGYSGEHSASVQKYKCLEKMREQIRNKNIAYEDFLE